MSMKYIREYYNVPAKRGARIKFDGKMGTIISSNGAKLRIKLDGASYSRLYHPTWNIEYVSFSQIGSGEMGIKYLDKDNLIPVLAVRQPWASLIMDHYKKYEVRSQNTNKRGTIAIYASRTKPRASDLALFDKTMGDAAAHQYGKIIAIADLVDCRKEESAENFASVDMRALHWNPAGNFVQDHTYYWILQNVRRVEPVEFKATSVVWSRIERDKLQVIPGTNCVPEVPA